MEKEKMICILTSLVSETWWMGYKTQTKTGKAIVERRLKQLSKALGSKLSTEELKKITCYIWH